MLPRSVAVIPAYDPDETMLTILEEAHEVFDHIVVVDDGSRAVCAPLFKKAERYATVLTHTHNSGKGRALKTAYTHILEQFGDEDLCVITLDCDGEHSVTDAFTVYEIAARCPDSLVLGQRQHADDFPLRARIGHAVTRGVFALATRHRLYDTQTGLRAFHITHLPAMLAIEGERYEYELNVLMYFAKGGVPMLEIPIDAPYAANHHHSRFDPLRDTLLVLAEIAKFSCSSFVSFLTDLLVYSLLGRLIGTTPLSLMLANIGARIVSASLNFFLNRRFVFHKRGNLLRDIGKFALLSAGLLTCSTVTLTVVTSFGVAPIPAKLFTEFFMFFVNWTLQHSVVFRRKHK